MFIQQHMEDTSSIPTDQPFCFVTVGTTKFDQLIRALDSEAVTAALHRRSIRRLVVQYGAGEYELGKHLRPLPFGEQTESKGSSGKSSGSSGSGSGSGSGGNGGGSGSGSGSGGGSGSGSGGSGDELEVYAFRYSRSIQRFVRAATIVISHAGAGSIKETLAATRPLIVVVNPLLMNNHQLEIAEALASRGCLQFAAAPSAERISALLDAAGQPGNSVRWPTPDLSLFPDFVEEHVTEQNAAPLGLKVALSAMFLAGLLFLYRFLFAEQEMPS